MLPWTTPPSSVSGTLPKLRKLKEQLKRVDVVLEVRDAGFPGNSPSQVAEVGCSKAQVLVLNRVDMISAQSAGMDEVV